MKQFYTKQKAANRHPKKYNFNSLLTTPVSERRRRGIFGADWFDFNERHYEEYVSEKKQLGVPDTFIKSWVDMPKDERMLIRENKDHIYYKYLEILPTEEDIEKMNEVVEKLDENKEEVESKTE